MTQTGVYVGNDIQSLAEYETFTQSAVNNVLNYLNNDNWSAFDSSINYETQLWSYSDTPSIWGVPLTVTGTPLSEVASGEHNKEFLAAATALSRMKPSSDGNIYIRLGWEFNGDWMPWSASGNEDSFIAAFQNIVSIFRSVSSTFKFVWDVNEGGGKIDPTQAYPGDNYVDVIGMDSYYNTQWDSQDPAVAFEQKVSEKFGLQWQQDFADAHKKATAMSEWGVNNDTSGPYVKEMMSWFTDHNMLYENYWNSNAGNYNGLLSENQYPDVSAYYINSVKELSHSGSQKEPPPASTIPPAYQQSSSVASDGNVTVASAGAAASQATTTTGTVSSATAVSTTTASNGADVTAVPLAAGSSGISSLITNSNGPAAVDGGTAASGLMADTAEAAGTDPGFTTVSHRDGSRTVQVTEPGHTIKSYYRDAFLVNGAADTTFVFDPGYGLDVLNGFRVTGTDHDTISLLGDDFSNSIAEVLRHTQAVSGGVRIVDPTSGDAIRLAGVTKAQLLHNRQDFVFHYAST